MRVGIEFGLLAPDTRPDDLSPRQDAQLHQWITANLSSLPAGIPCHRIDDSREGWAKAVELLESMAFRARAGPTLLLDLSAIRPRGARSVACRAALPRVPCR